MKKKLIIIFIVLLLHSNVIFSKEKSKLKNIYSFLKLENTIQTQITDNTDSIIAEPWQIEIFNGMYVILDKYSIKKVNVFDKNGKYIKTLNKVGEGPGEFGQPSFICKNKNEELIINGWYPEKFIFFNNKLKLITEKKLGANELGFFIRYGLYYNENFIIASDGKIGTGKNIFIFRKKQKPINIRDVKKLSPMEKIFSYGVPNMTVVKDKLWVGRMFDPFIDIFDIKTGKLVKTIGFKDRDYCVYSKNIKGINSNNYLTAFFKKIKGKTLPKEIINIDDKIVLYGTFNYKQKGENKTYFDIYSADGEIIQEQVLLPEKAKDYYSLVALRTSSKKLFLVNINLTEEEEEDFSSIIYQYGIKE